MQPESRPTTPVGKGGRICTPSSLQLSCMRGYYGSSCSTGGGKGDFDSLGEEGIRVCGVVQGANHSAAGGNADGGGSPADQGDTPPSYD